MKHFIYLFHFADQNYKDYIGVLTEQEKPEGFYGAEILRRGYSTSKSGASRRAKKICKEYEKFPRLRWEKILLAESEKKELQARHKKEWDNHKRKNLDIKFRGYLED
jgi:hypothetical protein